MQRTLLILSSFFLFKLSFAQPFLTTPVEGTQGSDWTIVNYVDWSIDGILDHQCGTKTYDGHQGTDYTLYSFEQMDTGVNVLAAADGVVTFVQDGLFDKETDGDVTKKLGNYIAIKHDNLYYTYYAHLKKNSLLVTVGDTVKQGEVIAEIGSSGNSKDPHLHFELWYDSSYLIDPFSGTCGNPASLWIDAPTYDTTLTIVEQGIKLKNDLSLNDLRFRDSSYRNNLSILPNSDSNLNYWAMLHGLRKGDVLTLRWYTPDGNEWFSFSNTLTQDFWYYYYWSFIDHTDLAEGEWMVSLDRNNNTITELNFTVEKTASIDTEDKISLCYTLQSKSLAELFSLYSEELTVLDTGGKTVDLSKLHSLPSGLYVLQLRNEHYSCKVKRRILNER